MYEEETHYKNYRLALQARICFADSSLGRTPYDGWQYQVFTCKHDTAGTAIRRMAKLVAKKLLTPVLTCDTIIGRMEVGLFFMPKIR